MDASIYGFSEQDLIDLRFYCDVTGKTPQELSSELREQSKDPMEAMIRGICYKFLSTKRTAVSVVELAESLKTLSEMKGG